MNESTNYNFYCSMTNIISVHVHLDSLIEFHDDKMHSWWVVCLDNFNIWFHFYFSILLLLLSFYNISIHIHSHLLYQFMLAIKFHLLLFSIIIKQKCKYTIDRWSTINASFVIFCALSFDFMTYPHQVEHVVTVHFLNEKLHQIQK